MATETDIMRCSRLTILLLSILFFVLSVSSPAQETGKVEGRTLRQTITPGVELIQEILPAGNEKGPLVVTIFQIDPKISGVRVEAALGQDRVWGTDATMGREIVSETVARHKAVAGVNAGFFPFAGSPTGLHIQGGNMVTEPVSNRTCLLVTKNGDTLYEAFSFAAKLTQRDNSEVSFPINGMNRRPGKGNELLIFTPIFFDATLKSPERVEVVLSGMPDVIRPNTDYTGTVTEVTTGGGTPLKSGTVILSGGGAAGDFLREKATPGTKWTFRLAVTPVSGKPFDFETVNEAVAGGPRLISEAKVDITAEAEGFAANFSTTRHPRTAAGTTRDGKLLLVTVDGRQKGVSRGMSLPELTELLLKYGVQNAVNLDGGGSSTAIVRNLIVNSPSDGTQRPVANALLVFAQAEKSEKTTSRTGESGLIPPAEPIKVGERFQCNGNGAKGLWGVTGGIGLVTQDGEFMAVRVGKGTIEFLPDGEDKPVSLPVTVVAKEATPPPTENRPTP